MEKNGESNKHFISKTFLKKALENGWKTPDITIEDIKISKACEGGDNYTSDILRVLVTYRQHESLTKQISLIMKVLTMQLGKDQKLLEEMEVLQREVNMYQNIIPRLENILKNQTKFSPRCLYATNQPVEVMVLEDLKALKYDLGDRLNGLDEDHAKVVFKKIAQFHAASMVLAKENPALMDPYNKGIFNEQSREMKIMKTIFLDNVEHLINVLKVWPGYESIAEKLEKLLPKYFLKCEEIAKPRANDIRVLNHGDLWVNNFMIKYEDKKPCDVAFIDFQEPYYSGLGLDINYFLNNSVQLDVLKTKRYDLLRYYYYHLKSTLQSLNYLPIPTWEEVKNEIRSKELYGFASLTGVFPLITMDRNASQDNSYETLSDDKIAEQKRDIMFSSERFRETLKYSLYRFDELGVFDDL